MLGRSRLRVNLRIGGHLDFEMITKPFPNETHQVDRMGEAAGLAIARGQVTPQGHQPCNALVFVAFEQGLHLGLACADAGHVRRNGRQQRLKLGHRGQGALASGPAGPVGDGPITGPQRMGEL
ncbi:MAG: hypothetical protein RIR28_981 [Pseudomonadota bacterium]